jgi:hypothetical protein
MPATWHRLNCSLITHVLLNKTYGRFASFTIELNHFADQNNPPDDPPGGDT